MSNVSPIFTAQTGWGAATILAATGGVLVGGGFGTALAGPGAGTITGAVAGAGIAGGGIATLGELYVEYLKDTLRTYR